MLELFIGIWDFTYGRLSSVYPKKKLHLECAYDYYLFSIMLNIPSCKKMTNKTWPKPYVIGKVNNISQISDGSGMYPKPGFLILEVQWRNVLKGKFNKTFLNFFSQFF